jgi:hypothetical protein
LHYVSNLVVRNQTPLLGVPVGRYFWKLTWTSQ